MYNDNESQFSIQHAEVTLWQDSTLLVREEVYKVFPTTLLASYPHTAHPPHSH